MVPLSYYLVLSGILFACGVTGFLIKRNIITIFMSIELMLNGVNLVVCRVRGALACAERPGICLLCDGGGRGGSAGGAGHHHRRLSYAGDFECGSGEPAQTMTPSLHLWLIPVLPLAGAAINGFLGKPSSRAGR